MDNLKRSEILLDNYKKALTNLSKRIIALEKASIQKDCEQIEIVRESIVQTNEVTVELAWKVARNLALEIEPNTKIAGSTTAIKHALKTNVIQDDKLARKLIGAIQDRNMSSHEYLLETGLEKYVGNIVENYYSTYLDLMNCYERILEELNI